jgi:enoyl-CoA hydratase
VDEPVAGAAEREPLRIERDGDVAIWALVRPAVKNALDRETFSALERALVAAASDRTLRAVVLTGDGDTFCSGGDLRDFHEASTRDHAEHLADAGRHLCDALAGLHVPVIAALPGPAIGGGAEMAMACDLRVADPRATICFKHARMGVTTAWGVMPKLVATVGHATASRLLLTGQPVVSSEAMRLGLVDAVSENGASLGTALAWGHDVAKGSPHAVAELKVLLSDCLAGMSGRRTLERQRFVETWNSADHREAVAAFFEGREPRWH